MPQIIQRDSKGDTNLTTDSILIIPNQIYAFVKVKQVKWIDSFHLNIELNESNQLSYIDDLKQADETHF